MEQQWGSNLSPNAVSMVHTKLELDLQDVSGELDMTIQVLDGMKNLGFSDMMAANGDYDRPAYSHKNPEEVVTDYLTKVFLRLEEVVEGFTDAFRRHVATDIVVTVPTVSHRVTITAVGSHMPGLVIHGHEFDLPCTHQGRI
jgi:hypothetical protein